MKCFAITTIFEEQPGRPAKLHHLRVGVAESEEAFIGREVVEMKKLYPQAALLNHVCIELKPETLRELLVDCEEPTP